MVHILSGLLAAMQLMLPMAVPHMLTLQLQSGQWLRFHVVAQDDTAEMQRIKLCVRDAVQACYIENRSAAEPSMLAQAEKALPLLTKAAEAAARREGFTGEVRVTLESCAFDDRQLGGADIPAGEYPALMIRLGEARGRNWWGLLDPELSLLLARASHEGEEKTVIWDWSWEAFWAAFFNLPMTEKGA